MKWHKHMSDMIEDPKVRRLVKKFGTDGYAVYNLALEKIAKRLDTESPRPDLEETAEDMADLLRMDTVRVEEVMLHCINDGLFEQDEVDGRILCQKIYKFFDQSQTRNVKIKQMISEYSGVSETVSDSHGLSRLEENRIEESIRAKTAHKTLNVPINQKRYAGLCTTYGQSRVDAAIQERLDWEAAKGKPAAKDYAAAAANWLKNATTWGGGDELPLKIHKKGDPL